MVSASELPRALALADGLCVVGASAGSGKTHHLTNVVLQALAGGDEAALDVESLVAVTYTQRAATELRSRIRQELVRQGASESALRLPLARLGTVHAVCLSWVEDFAVDAGLPPSVKVLPDDGGLEFRRLLESAIPAELQARLSSLAQGLQVKWDNMRGRSDWLWHVFELIELARANRIAPSALPEMAQRSAAWMTELLPAPSERDLDAALAGALERALEDLQASADSTKTTRTVLEEMRSIRRAFEHGRATWKDWASLAALEPAKKSKPLLESLQTTAAEFEAHPRFQRELGEMISGVFQCAGLGLERYQSWKENLRLVDYVDMLERALGLLDRPEVARELAQRLGLIVVDEFQDTSPIQLELFLRLHQLTQRSTWVGDRKQCIFEFAGADPQLMDSVIRWVADNGGATQQLEHNYRSRPELVTFCSELFSRALAPHGYAREEVAVLPRRAAPPELASLPPIGIFSLATTNAEQQALALARGVQRLLAAPGDTPIVDRHTGLVRPLQPGDVAVLVRTNLEAVAIARAMGQLGIRAALPRPGLLQTPEGTLVDAALSYLADRTDGVAAATLDALHGFADGDPDRWLSEQIGASHARRDAAAAARAVAAHPATSPALPEPAPANDVLPEPLSGWRARLAPLALQSRQLSPRETLDVALQVLDLDRFVRGWPDPDQRSGNLDALRALASRYEDACRVAGAAASLAGLLHYFDQAGEPLWDGTEMRANDEQHYSQGPNAVVLCTYHRSKGLEWPVVILASLDAAPRADAFGVKIQSPATALDPEHPLDGRWIRYCPRPLAGRTKNLGFAEREAQSEQGREARQDECCERARLLYVGFTRARDHLILAARNRKGELEAQWLDELRDAEGDSLLTLPASGDAEGTALLTVAGTQTRVAARVWEVDVEPVAPAPANDTTQALAWKRPSPVGARPSYWITPSSAAECWSDLPALRVGDVERIAPSLRVQWSGSLDRAGFGDTVHGFLAADRVEHELDLRRQRARRLLDACDSGASVEPDALIGLSDALHAFVQRRWPGAVWHREIPIRVRVGVGDAARRVNGGIDLLLETEDGYVVIDHKTYGNPDPAAVRAHAEQYLPQLGAYGAAIDALGGKRVREYWLHFGVGGVACEVLAAKRPNLAYEPAQPHPDTDSDLNDYCDEMEANQNPTRAEWQALMDRWEGRVNIESLLVIDGLREYLD
jgi:ATP-dependent helicase/nuclease subunit A